MHTKHLEDLIDKLSKENIDIKLKKELINVLKSYDLSIETSKTLAGT